MTGGAQIAVGGKRADRGPEVGVEGERTDCESDFVVGGEGLGEVLHHALETRGRLELGARGVGVPGVRHRQRTQKQHKGPLGEQHLVVASNPCGRWGADTPPWGLYRSLCGGSVKGAEVQWRLATHLGFTNSVMAPSVLSSSVLYVSSWITSCHVEGEGPTNTHAALWTSDMVRWDGTELKQRELTIAAAKRTRWAHLV